MNITMQPGRYVLAVSGGVDSMALLDVLAKNPDIQLIVAHYDHGIREDSAEDRRLVQDVAKKHDVTFVYDEGHLGKGTSESTARDARYKFLHTVRGQSESLAIVTAHHQDDMLETAILNMVRGTGRKGVSSLGTTEFITRPLLEFSKNELVQYAQDNNLQWREDSTNQDVTYKRNYVRHNVLTRLTIEQRTQLVTCIKQMHLLNQRIDHEITNQLHIQPSTKELGRKYFNQLPYKVAVEVLAAWLRQSDVREFDSKGLNRTVMLAKTLPKDSKIDVDYKYIIEVGGQNLALRLRDR